LSELKYIERSRKEEESRIVGNWLLRLKSSIDPHERSAFKYAMDAANITLADLEKRSNLTQAKLDVALNVMHGHVPDILFRSIQNVHPGFGSIGLRCHVQSNVRRLWSLTVS